MTLQAWARDRIRMQDCFLNHCSATSGIFSLPNCLPVLLRVFLCCPCRTTPASTIIISQVDAERQYARLYTNTLTFINAG